MAPAPDQIRKQIDDLLNLPQQAWLLGAGASRAACLPLMVSLTERVGKMLDGTQKDDFEAIRETLADGAHVEHVLSHIGDLIALVSRTKSGVVEIGTKARSLKELTALHATIQESIRETIRWGYEPATGSSKERIGKREEPLVTVEGHRAFVRALFHVRRANLERRPPVALFTTNYDTLVEDALALERVRASDGFIGGAMAFWDGTDLCEARRGDLIGREGLGGRGLMLPRVVA